MAPVRTVLRLLVAAALVLALVGAAPPSPPEQELLARTNRLRASEGLPALVLKDRLTDRARAWAADLARRGTLEHSDLRTVEPGWTRVGENVGRSTSIADVFRRLEASPSHRRTMVNPHYVRIGVGVARAADGNLYVVQVFWRGCGPDGEAHC